MNQDFKYTTFGATGLKVHRLGLSATYRPSKDALHQAIDAGVNVFFCYGFDTQMTGVLRDLFKTRRDKLYVVTGAYNFLIGHLNIRKTLEKRLRQLGTDYIDIFQYQGVTKPKHMTDHVLEEMNKLKQEGKIRFTGMTCHDRKFAGKLISEGTLDTYMIRYNAAHRGAEQDIFPHLTSHNPDLISYTATRWRFLINRQRGWPKDAPIPTPELCYRFVLSNPHVHVCMNAPSNVDQLKQNLSAIEAGPLSDDEMKFICKYGDHVHTKKKLLG